MTLSDQIQALQVQYTDIQNTLSENTEAEKISALSRDMVEANKKIAELTKKLDEQSAIIMQIGMMSSTPPTVPTEPPKPGELPPVDMTAVPDAGVLANMMGSTTPPDVPTP